MSAVDRWKGGASYNDSDCLACALRISLLFSGKERQAKLRKWPHLKPEDTSAIATR
jgi:hypothetical protein